MHGSQKGIYSIWKNTHNSITIENETHIGIYFCNHKDLGNIFCSNIHK